MRNNYSQKHGLLRLFLGVWACFFALGATGQDLHFSQFDLNTNFQNPALSGQYVADWRAAAQYRSQWESVPVQYRTASISYDTKILRRRHNMLAGGLLLAQDQAGDGQLTWTQIGAQLSAAHTLSAHQVISVGFGFSGVQRKIDLTDLKFNNQWDGDIYDPSRPSKENLQNRTGLRPSLSAGLNWHYRTAEIGKARTFADIGIAASHLNRPSMHFATSQEAKLPIRYGLYANSRFQYTETTDWVVFGQYQRMTKAAELVVGAGAWYWLGEETGVRLAAALRTRDAIIPSVQFQQREWLVGLSYDINISKYNIATGRRGGFELAVVYAPTPVKPLKELKVCPTF